MLTLSTLGLHSARSAETATPPSEIVTVNPLSRDRSLFDSGWAVGLSSAEVPVSGTGTEGFTVQVRALSVDDGGVSSTAWTDLSTIGAGGTWSGTLSAPRSASWFRTEARLKELPVVRAQGATRFGVGHVIAIWGQSEVDHIVSAFHNSVTPEPVADPEAVQIVTGAVGSPARLFVTTATPQTAAVAALANTLIATRPGEKFAVIFHGVPGTDPRDLVNDAQTGRSWAADRALHDFACADGQSVGIAAMSWFASPRSLAGAYGEALFPLFSGRTLAGGAVSIPGAITHAAGSYQADHWFGELYNYARTRWVPYGPHRFDGTQDLQDATHLAGGAVDSGIQVIQSCRGSWRAMLANPQATMFLPLGIEPTTYVNGYSDGAGGWTDHPHPAGNTLDGCAKWARLTAHAILRSAGLASWAIPVFDNCYWDPTGSYVEVWSSAGPVTTTRALRGEATLPATFPHWTGVIGFQINGAPATDAQIVAGRVRLQKPGGFVFGDTLTFGEGGATGNLQTPEDHIAALWKNLPVVDVGAPGVEGIPVRPMPDAAALANTLPAVTPTFTVSNTNGPRFLDPVGMGATGKLTAVFEGSFVTPAVSCQPLAPGGANVTVTILNTRKLRIYLKDSANTVLVNNVVLANALPTGAVRLAVSTDLAAGYLRVWVNGILEGDFTLATNSGAIALASRQISLLASNTGTNQVGGTFTRLLVWKDATVSGANPVAAPYKSLIGPAASVNADAWKLGSNAT